MSAVLRAYGLNFDVVAYLVGCTLPICTVKRRGEAAFPASQPQGRKHDQSGVHVLASGADFEEFARQVDEATAFLRDQEEQLRRLCEFPGVDNLTLDFGIPRRDVYVQSDHFPPELVRLAGSLGFGITLTQYPIGDAKLEDGT